MDRSPTIVYQCTKCRNQFTRGSNNRIIGYYMSSGNYSDFKFREPLLSIKLPSITICTKCNSIIRISEAEKIGSFGGYDFNFEKLETEMEKEIVEEWRELEEARFLTVYEYYRMVKEKMVKNNLDEFNIRINILHGFNDRVRDGGKLHIHKTDKIIWFENIESLIYLSDFVIEEQKTEIDEFVKRTGLPPSCLNLLDYKLTLPQNYLFLAELQRYLGHFEQCMNIINDIGQSEYLCRILSENEYKNYKRKFKKECDAKNTKVFQLN